MNHKQLQLQQAIETLAYLTNKREYRRNSRASETDRQRAIKETQARIAELAQA